ncbi:hypothetical protein CHCC14566_4855 [Bacillus licheniformis]|nr:hypothetical protein CHCC14566_4855 [Bacillus licheniformis]
MTLLIPTYFFIFIICLIPFIGVKALYKNNIACLRKSVNNYFTYTGKMFYEKSAACEQQPALF